MSTFTIPNGYEKIDGNLYPTRATQISAYDDIRLAGTSGLPGAFLYGKPKPKPVASPTATKESSFKLAWPLDKVYITQGFGENPRYYAKYGLKGHDGIDLRTRFLDSPLAHRYVTAAAGGTCEVRDDGRVGYGLHIRIHHPDGSMTIYGHLSRVYVGKNKVVSVGERIGITGNTGDSTGPHLHFEYRPPNWNSANGFAGAVDPLSLLPFYKK